MWAEFGMMINVRVELVKLSFDVKEKQKNENLGARLARMSSQV